MYILAFDSINNYFSAAIYKDSDILDSIVIQKESIQSEIILVVIESILIKNSLSYGDINYFVTTTGPGSFIRIRIGLAVAFGIEFALNIRIYGVNLFDLYNFYCIDKLGLNSNLIILTAYQNNFYIKNYLSSNETFVSQAELEEILNHHPIKSSIICDSKAFDKISSSTNHNFINIQCNISNISEELAIYFSDQITKPNLNENCSLKPFYLLNPSFVKKI